MRYQKLPNRLIRNVLWPACAALVLGGCTKKAADGETPAPKPVELGEAKALGSISVKAPAAWKSSPPTSNMRRAQWDIGVGEKASQLVIFYFGKNGAGSVQSNLDRWFGQFEQADGKPSKEAAKVEETKIADLKVTRAEVAGRFVAQVRPGAQERHDKPEYQMLAAIVEAPDGPYYFKLDGPKATVEEARSGFDAMLNSIAVTGGTAGGAAAHPNTDPEEEKKKQERAARVAEAVKKDEEKANKELERWTDELRKKATDLVSTKYKNNKKALQAILASSHRTPGNSDRDKHRHPLETLMFFGLEPGMTVIEAGAGQGWYTEILAPFLANKGQLILATYDPAGAKDSFRTVYGLRIKRLLAKSPEIFGKVKTSYIEPPEKIALAPDGTVDMILAFREMHNWHRGGQLDAWVASVHKALKPGGVFGIVQHRAKKGDEAEQSAQKGRLPVEFLVKKLGDAGFDLADQSEVNANPKDSKDYEKGVWALPPALANKDEDKDKYLAIGESDRMTLKFVKRK